MFLKSVLLFIVSIIVSVECSYPDNVDISRDITVLIYFEGEHVANGILVSPSDVLTAVASPLKKNDQHVYTIKYGDKTDGGSSLKEVRTKPGLILIQDFEDSHRIRFGFMKLVQPVEDALPEQYYLAGLQKSLQEVNHLHVLVHEGDNLFSPLRVRAIITPSEKLFGGQLGPFRSYSVHFPGTPVCDVNNRVLFGLTVHYMDVQDLVVPFNPISEAFKDIKKHLEKNEIKPKPKGRLFSLSCMSRPSTSA